MKPSLPRSGRALKVQVQKEKPERLALEPWLYRLAMSALDELSRPEGSNGGAVQLEESARKQNVRASDEPGTAVPSARRSHHRGDHHRRRPRAPRPSRSSARMKWCASSPPLCAI